MNLAQDANSHTRRRRDFLHEHPIWILHQPISGQAQKQHPGKTNPLRLPNPIAHLRASQEDPQAPVRVGG